MPVVQMLFNKGAQVKSPNVIAAAANNQNKEMVQFLITKGAAPGDGLLPALSKNNKEIVELLLSSGADGGAPKKPQKPQSPLGKKPGGSTKISQLSQTKKVPASEPTYPKATDKKVAGSDIQIFGKSNNDADPGNTASNMLKNFGFGKKK